jgi:hypothetical protein
MYVCNVQVRVDTLLFDCCCGGTPYPLSRGSDTPPASVGAAAAIVPRGIRALAPYLRVARGCPAAVALTNSLHVSIVLRS